MTLTIPDMIAERARQFGRRPALGIRRGLRTETWSYHDVERAMRRAADHLRACGVAPGDRVLMLAANSPELAISMLGVWAAGAVLVPIDVRTPADVMARIAERTTPRLLISEVPDALPGMVTLTPMQVSALTPPAPLSRLRERGELPSRSPLPRVGDTGIQPQLRGPVVREGSGVRDVPDGLAEIVFTSGTTGAPKGVMLTHANILANVASAQATLAIPTGERLLSLLPLSHMMEQTAGLLASLAAGATVYFATSRRSSAILAAFQRHGIGVVICVPEILTLLLAGIEREVDRTGKRRAWDMLNAAAARLPIGARPALFRAVHQRLGGRFRLALCGGAALSESVRMGWERLGVRVIQGYGATECSPIIASNHFDHRVPDTVGWPIPNVEIRLAADGEVQVRGPNVTPGYWHDSEATAASFDDGWYRTGDLGEWGPEQTLRLRGRKKEMIVLSDGRNVFPEDVEPVLRADPAVRDCAVVGRPRDVRSGGSGVEIHAVVIPANGPADRAGAEAAVRRANGTLGPHQQIGGWSVWEDADFPRTPSLKVKRNEVLASLAAHHAPTAVAPASAAGDTLEARVTGLLARATGRPTDRINPASDLHLDLGLDSLGRVELAVLLEEELGRSLSDEQVAGLKSVGDLLHALEQPANATPPPPLPRWPRWRPVRALRAMLQDAVLFPLVRFFARPLTVEGAEHLTSQPGPVLLIANHTSHLDGITVLSALPPARRRRTAVAAAADYFFTDGRRAMAASIALGAFPFHRTGPVATSLAHCGDLADSGYSLLVFPEGTRAPDGKIAPFKPGIGLLARELGVPVVPVYMDGLFRILPKGRTLPRRDSLRVVIGAPRHVDPSLSNTAAAALLEADLRALAPPRP